MTFGAPYTGHIAPPAVLNKYNRLETGRGLCYRSGMFKNSGSVLSAGTKAHSALAFLALALAAWSAGAASPGQVARVLSGELKEARASWWGFDPDDATRTLQDAINSRVPRLIVDQTGAPWVTDRLTCVSDQEIVFERGVEVLAKKGAFTGKTDSLLSLEGVTNVTLRGPGATLRMRRADYDAPPYTKAEWRHVLNIRSSVNIRVLGLTLAESGGDGVYLGALKGRGTNRDILIQDVLCDRNYRQGISVITAENLLIENTVMRDTAGTPPAAGIDFEPNHAHERLKNCVLRNCVSENNEGGGFHFYLPNLTRDSEPVSIRLEKCRSVKDKSGVTLTTGNSDEGAVRGAVAFVDCRFEDAQRSGATVSRKPASGLALSFERCVLARCAATNMTPDILLLNRMEDEWPVGGIRLDSVAVMQPVPRPWIAWQNNTTVAEPVAGLTGAVTVTCGEGRQTVELTPEWAARTFPPRFTVRVPRVAGDLAKAQVTDRLTGARALSPLRVRRACTYVLYATKGLEVALSGMQTQVGRYEAGDRPLVVRAPSGIVAKRVPMPGFKSPAEIRFVAAESGFYTLEVEVGANAFLLQEANVPVAVDATRKAANFIRSAGSLFVPVPQGTGVFAFGAVGEGVAEAVKVEALDPSGAVVWSKESVTQMERFTATAGQGAAGGVWEIRLSKPSQGGFEDFHVEALGVPGYLFLNKDRFWQ